MLTDVALKNLKPKDKPYKVTDRDGMYAHVSTSGAISLRLDLRLHGRRETVTLGHYVLPGCRSRELAKSANRTACSRSASASRRLTKSSLFGRLGSSALRLFDRHSSNCPAGSRFSSLFGRLGSSALRLFDRHSSNCPAGSRFSPESALRPLHNGVRRMGWNDLKSVLCDL